jgi:hypothetical protein
MKNTHLSGILLGMGILCAGTFATNIESANAAPNNYEGRRDYRDRDDRDRDDRDRRGGDRDGRDRDDRDRRDRNGRNDRDWRNDSRPDWNNNRPNYNYGNYGGRYPNYNQGSPYRGNQSSTIEGVVVQDLNGNSFLIRTNNGRQIRVVARGGESRRISRGDIVRAYGSFNGNSFNAQNVSIIRNR